MSKAKALASMARTLYLTWVRGGAIEDLEEQVGAQSGGSQTDTRETSRGRCWTELGSRSGRGVSSRDDLGLVY